ncbi:MAG: hypothetical protein QMD13_00595 [Candidatus Bathyarchaeia archaeon]|nr:hypothetical protein [Candidatus Bathyarchaeia archaeon]
MKREALMFTALTIGMLVLASTAFNIKDVKAKTDYTIEQENHTIEQVNHTIEVMYNGYIFINDTIRITVQASNGFLIGFPYKYGLHILRCTAYNETDTFPVSLNVPLDNRVGFYGVKVNFPQGTPQVFTVGFVLSNNLLSFTQNHYTLDFPAYPSLTNTATNCSVVIILPEGAKDVTVAKDDGAVNASTYLKQNLPAFTYSSANVTFSLTGDEIQLFDIKELRREVRINGIGEIEGSDSYYIKSKMHKEINSIEIILPPNASNPTAQDQFGRKIPKPVQIDEKTNRYRITFTLPLKSYNSTTRFTVKYYLPREVYIKQEGSSNFDFTSPLLQHVNHYIEKLSVTFVLPEGAKVSSENASVSGVCSTMRGVFQEAVTINRQGVFSLDSFNVKISYEYTPLWLSFRPTLWMWALAVAGCAIAVVWKRPRAPVPVAVPKVVVRLSPEHIRTFVTAYEEKRKIILEIKSLEARVRKGKIPRRRYKVRRRTLETRLNALSRNLSDLKEKLRAVGGRYRDLMHQLEVAETEINEVEANIESIEARHRRGELSLGAYRKLLADYKRRKEKSETTIDGILIRLREEIR